MKEPRRLQLTRETLKKLERPEAAEVQGGVCGTVLPPSNIHGWCTTGGHAQD